MKQDIVFQKLTLKNNKWVLFKIMFKQINNWRYYLNMQIDTKQVHSFFKIQLFDVPYVTLTLLGQVERSISSQHLIY
jgi:hypothetical protein